MKKYLAPHAAASIQARSPTSRAQADLVGRRKVVGDVVIEEELLMSAAGEPGIIEFRLAGVLVDIVDESNMRSKAQLASSAL